MLRDMRTGLKKTYWQVTRLTLTVVIGFVVMANAADVTINLSANKQVIKGFGASSAWCGTISATVMDALYKTLGYTILRVRIEEGIGDAWSSGNFSSWAAELANAKKAVANGAIVFASPWNPPASMKSGGKLNTSKYADYANYLKAYAKYFSDNGAPLYAVSLQNEPDYASAWTAWTATDLLNFLKEQGATLSSACKIMMPESFQFRHPMSDPSLNDATVASYISIIGGHLYGAGLADYPLAKSLGKELWETEHYFDDDNISNVMALAKEIHDCMVTASMNAYVYWWITWPNGLYTNNAVQKRAYVIGQFSKYVRTGYYRVDATASPGSNVYVSAYKGDNNMVIVAVNTGTASVSQKFIVQNGTVSQVSTWQTTSSSNMTAGQDIQVSGGSFSATLPGQSVTTFVGATSGVAIEPRPAFSPIGTELHGFKAGIAKESIIVTPLSANNAYDISVHMLDGRQIMINNGVKGISSIPVRSRGIYLININCNGHIQRKMVSVF
jgi:glucuronoarabinoxylan endo-1,4-beta-xylanase